MGKWTKKDVKALCGHLDTFWLLNRPLGSNREEFESTVAKVRETLATKRVDVVLAGIRSFANMHAERYLQNCSTVGNEIARFNKTLDDELVQRFVKFAREEDADCKRANSLRERVQAEGLPSEVIAYDPTTK